MTELEFAQAIIVAHVRSHYSGVEYKPAEIARLAAAIARALSAQGLEK